MSGGEACVGKPVSRERAAREIARIASLVRPVCERHPAMGRLYLFGSRAKGEHRVTSDYDLYAVLNYDSLDGAGEYLALVDELEHVLRGRVDFVSGEVWTARDMGLKEEIERSKELLYDCDAQ